MVVSPVAVVLARLAAERRSVSDPSEVESGNTAVRTIIVLAGITTQSPGE